MIEHAELNRRFIKRHPAAQVAYNDGLVGHGSKTSLW